LKNSTEGLLVSSENAKSDKVKIEVKNLYKVFGPNPEQAVELARQGVGKDELFRRTESVVAVNDVSMTVREREMFVVMGLSGSGKSTLIRCFNRLFQPDSGSILIDGEDVVSANEEELRSIRLNKMTMVFQHFALFPHRTVGENVEYGLKVRGVEPAARRERAIEALEVVGLDAWADSYPSSLSGGMQQRVGLARALAVDPDVMLMDEPFSALDPLIRRDMQDELIRIQEKFQTTIIFITHDLGEALRLGDQVAIMKDGRFVQVGSPEEIVTDPADDYVEAFTQDVDRSRVVTIGNIQSEARPLIVGDDTAATAQARLRAEQCDALYVTNGNNKPVGIVLARDLVDPPNEQPVEQIMRREFPEVGPEEPIFEVYERCMVGLPLAVVNGDGVLQGIVAPTDVFTSLNATETVAGAVVESMPLQQSQ
jgi:glycine betaine/proline transport system ATP-binding protein